MITVDNVYAAIAANFGDTGARWSSVDAPLLAKQILEAHQRQSADEEWVERILDEQFAAPKVAEDLATIFQEAIRGA